MTGRENEVTELLRAATRTLRAAELPDHLQAAGFHEAVRLLTSELPTAPARRPSTQESDEEPASQGGTIEQIARRLDLDVDVVGRLFTAHNGALQVTAPPSRLASSRRAAMRELIHLVALGRQIGGWDTGATPVSILRQTCESYGPRFFDSNNFQNAINDLGDQLRRVGQGRQQAVILTPLGRDDGRALAQRLAANQAE